MKARAIRFQQVSRLLTVLVFFVWAILPGICATMCSGRFCCQSKPKPSTAQKQDVAQMASCAMCTHCPSTPNCNLISKNPTSGSCCKWIAGRLSPQATPDHPLLVFDSPAILPSAFPHLAAEKVECVGSIPGYSGLAPPKPIAFLPADRGPPIG